MVDVQRPPRARPVLPGRRRRQGVVLGLVVVIVVALVTIAVLLVGSDDEANTSEPLATTATPASPPPSISDPQDAIKATIVASYRRSFEVFVEIGTNPNGDAYDPRLAEGLIGNAKVAAQLALQEMRNKGQVFEGTITVHPVVVDLRADTAVVEDCGIDRVRVVDAATGVPVDPTTEERPGSLARATYKLIGGVWLQASFDDLETTCVPPAS